jgi:hypothetical protein
VKDLLHSKGICTGSTTQKSPKEFESIGRNELRSITGSVSPCILALPRSEMFEQALVRTSDAGFKKNYP